MKLKKLIEEWENQITVDKKTYPIYKNPSPKELFEIIKEERFKNRGWSDFTVIIDTKTKNVFITSGSIFHYKLVQVIGYSGQYPGGRSEFSKNGKILFTRVPNFGAHKLYMGKNIEKLMDRNYKKNFWLKRYFERY
jgi:hypothetical protein